MNKQKNNILLCIVSVLLITISSPVQAESPEQQINKPKSFGYLRVQKLATPTPEVKKDGKKAPKKIAEKNNVKNKSSLAQPPWRLDAGLRIAEIEIINGKYTQALKTLKKVLDRHPANTDAYTYIGYSYMKLGMLEKAEKNFGYALKISPDHMGAYIYTGLLSLEQGKPKMAMEALQAIRVICRGMICMEENYLSNKINSYKKDNKK